MRQLTLSALMTVLALMALLSAPVPSAAQETHSATLNARREIPVCFSEGTGTFEAIISGDGTSIAYTLTYQDISPPTEAHIHFGHRFEAAGVIVFLCGGGNKPACPAPTAPGTPQSVTGTLVAADVVGPTTQGINAGEFAKLVEAIRDGVTYANVHSGPCPGGEIRGHIR
jgi:hypothetical protein